MALMSRVTYIGDGIQTAFTVPYPFLSREDVAVKVNSITVPIVEYTWTSDSLITFYNAPLTNDIIDIIRVSPIENRLVDFNDNSILTENDLDTAHLQHFYLMQELIDGYASKLEDAAVNIATENGLVVTDPAQVINQLVAEVLNDQLAADLQQRITDIDLNAQNIVSHTTLLDGLRTDVDGAAADILTEQTLRIDGDTALASDMALIGAVNVGQTAFVINTSTAYVDATTSLASKFSTIQGGIDGNTASISTLQTVTVPGLEGDIDDLEARYGVSLNVNGYITGFEQFNDGSSGTFQILADKFYIVDPASGGQNPTLPFAVDGGSVYMNSAFIKDGSIGTAKIGDGQITNAKVNTLSAAKITNGSILSNAVYIGADNKFRLNGNNRRLTITDDQASPIIRVSLGRLDDGSDPTAYGLVVKDAAGNEVLNADGLGVDVVGLDQVIDAAINTAKLALNAATSGVGYKIDGTIGQLESDPELEVIDGDISVISGGSLVQILASINVDAITAFNYCTFKLYRGATLAGATLLRTYRWFCEADQTVTLAHLDNAPGGLQNYIITADFSNTSSGDNYIVYEFRHLMLTQFKR